MIELSYEYTNNILSMFGDIGKKWLERIPGIIDKYIKEFELTNIKVNDNLTYNVLMFCDSVKFGKIVLKIEIPFPEMTIRESRALELNAGIGACKCYYKNINDGVVILERLEPGYSLNEIESLEERIKIFFEVANKFNIKVNDDCGLPTYDSILNRSVDMVLGNDKYADIRSITTEAARLYNEIDRDGDNNYLLHADLYSDNIVMSKEGYKAIDPHGFVGNKILDTAIIIQKELDKIGYNDSNLDYIFELVSRYTNYSKYEIVRALYVNYVLNICWDREVNIINMESIKNAAIIYDYMLEFTYGKDIKRLIKEKE